MKTACAGLALEDFEVGDVHHHVLWQPITQADNIWLTLVTVNSNPIHFDSVLAAPTEFGRPLVDPTPRWRSSPAFRSRTSYKTA